MKTEEQIAVECVRALVFAWKKFVKNPTAADCIPRLLADVETIIAIWEGRNDPGEPYSKSEIGRLNVQKEKE